MEGRLGEIQRDVSQGLKDRSIWGNFGVFCTSAGLLRLVGMKGTVVTPFQSRKMAVVSFCHGRKVSTVNLDSSKRGSLTTLAGTADPE